MSFEGKHVLVTGGNSGIGKATAQEFISEGARVVIIGRNKKTLTQTQKELGSNCVAIDADLSVIKEINGAFNEAKKELNHLDVLILNAGVAKHCPTEQATEKDFDAMYNTNVKGLYFSFQASMNFLAPKASIIAISSISTQLSIAAHGIYASSKAAVDRLMSAFSAEFLKEKEWRFNCISPGYTDTPIFDERKKADPNFSETKQKMMPQGRFLEPKEIAKCALFLSSSDARGISGANLVVDGGFVANYPLSQLNQYYEAQ